MLLHDFSNPGQSVGHAAEHLPNTGIDQAWRQARTAGNQHGRPQARTRRQSHRVDVLAEKRPQFFTLFGDPYRSVRQHAVHPKKNGLDLCKIP